jgi:Tol biopolymer transport system component
MIVIGLGQPSFSPAGDLERPSTLGSDDDPLRNPRETRLRNVRQLTFGGTNAEAYFSPEGRRLVFQSTRDPFACDQIFLINADGSDVRLVSTGKGRTTCGFFYPDGKRILYSSTHLAGDECPPRPDRSQGYVWGVYSSFQIVAANDEGRIVRQLTEGPGYNAEATISPRGDKIVFTSSRDGDLEIYTMNLDGGDVRRLTHEPGYDGGPFFSPDGQWIVYRAHHPLEAEALARYRDLLARELVEPSKMDLFVMRSDGSDKRQITRLAGASFAPSFFPDGERIIFSSNFENPGTNRFELYAVRRDGTALERLTYSEGFNSFPMFSPDGRKLVFISNRHARQPREFNVFLADGVP